MSYAAASDGMRVLTIVGEIDLAGTDVLSDILHSPLIAGLDVVLDLSEVTFLGERGISMLVTAAHTAVSHGRELTVVTGEENRAVIRPLLVSGVDKILSLTATLPQALLSDASSSAGHRPRRTERLIAEGRVDTDVERPALGPRRHIHVGYGTGGIVPESDPDMSVHACCGPHPS